MELSKKGKAVVGSLTLAIDSKAKEMQAAGKDVVGFGAGEPDFGTPAHIVQAGIEALNKGVTRYTPAQGTLDLRKAICEKLKKENGLSYEANQIVVSNGAKHSLFNVFQALLNPGDEVLLPTPFWVSYPEMVKMADGVVVYVEAGEDTGFKLTVDQLRAAITPRTKCLILNSPSNPTGGVYTPEELKAIAELAVEKGIYVVSDEIYEELVYDGAQKYVSIASFGKEIQDLTIIVNGMSKAYAMTGWRIGYTASTKEIAGIMSNYQSHATSNPNSVAQYASVAALRGPREELDKMIGIFAQRRDYMVDKINSIPGLSCLKPGGAFYVFMNISALFGKKSGDRTITDSMSFADVLLDEELVAVVPGVAFGAEGFVRLSYATSMENIQKGLDRIEHFVGSLV